MLITGLRALPAKMSWPMRSMPVISSRLYFSHPPIVPPSRIAYRSFSYSPIIRNVPPSTPTHAVPPPAPPPPPPSKSRFQYFQYLRLLRYIPYKTILAIALLAYVATRTDVALRESIEAILAQFTVPENTWLYLNLNDLHITDSPHSERALQLVPFVSSTGKRRMTVLEMTSTIVDAAHDPRIKGLVLAFNQSMIEHRPVLTGDVIESHLGMGALNELGRALKYFSDVKKMQRGIGSSSVESTPVEQAEETTKSADSTPEEKVEKIIPYDLSQDVIIAIADNYSSPQYSLASLANRILLQPSGQILLTGMSKQQLFFGKVLEKYGIDFKVEARRDYKSALASLTDSGWNEKTRQNLEDLLWSLQTQTFHDLYLRFFRREKIPLEPVIEQHSHPELFAISGMEQSVGEEQKTFRKELKSVIDILQQGPFNFSDASKLGLIDAPMYHQDFLATLAESGVKIWSVRKYLDSMIAQGIFGDVDRSKWVIPQLFKQGKEGGTSGSTKEVKQGKLDGTKTNQGIPGVRLDLSLVATTPDPKIKDTSLKVEVIIPQTVGLVYLDNSIEGKGRFGGEAIAAYILKAAREPNIDVIVFRINSPGGDAVASDTIWRALNVARLYKPVVASFGDVAASGGYYAAAAADMIFSNQHTITGSIGVIAGYPVIKRLLDKIEVTSDSIKFLPNAAWNNMELGLPETEMEKLRAHIDFTYDQFKHVVSLGRQMDLDRVEQVAQGQVFTGAQAHRLGLVDQIGSLHEALGAAGMIALERKTNGGETHLIREYMGDEMKVHFDDALAGGDLVHNATKEQIAASPHFKGQPEPTSEEIHALLKRQMVSIRPQIRTVIIPHVNLANEALGVAISSAFQSDDERSPIPIDQPIVDPKKDSPANVQERLVMGALLGIVRSNDIPVWQIPMFCYWYAAQAAGNVGDGMMGGFMNTWFAKLFGNQQVLHDTMGYARMITGGPLPMFASGRTSAWDIRMEMPPLQIFF